MAATDRSTPLSRALKAARVTAGRSMRDIAGALGVSREHVCNVEAGRARQPRPELIERLARMYGVDAQPLLDLAHASGPHELRAGPTEAHCRVASKLARAWTLLDQKTVAAIEQLVDGSRAG